MNELKRFIKWCIDNDIAFTHINEAVSAFRSNTSVEVGPLMEYTITDGSGGCGRYPCICGTAAPCQSSMIGYVVRNAGS